ncbi:competence protein ComEC [Aeromicrobium panaciterrae]|uniref:Competence protein ComEC n=1 Tax=Aeromicrobium panaciterrae TaxID=363861 RepID=A0ABU1UN19_9ACTN|nr:DNA internalization-related competence protein ComEC/Rec2 [Aeromicrobium panaciterrae]MDR7086554.1 competence protein ComEC [Aeromicrobium panaciterrae]
MAAPALLCWAVAATLVTSGANAALVVALVCVLAAGIAARRPSVAVLAITVAAIAASCAWRLNAIEHSPVTQLAAEHRIATLDVEVRRDATTFQQHGQESIVVELLVRRVVSRDMDVRTRDRVTAFIDGSADDLVVGRRLTIIGRLAPSDATDEAAVIDVVRRGPTDRASWWWEVSETVREGVRTSVERTADEPRALVPALVDGDDSRVSDEVKEDFRRAGLTHLMAVSGTNLTIVLAVLLVVGRAVGVRRRGLWVLGAVSIVGFVILARPDPSVVRAAAMGAVGVAALGYGHRGGVRALAWAIIALLFIDPWLSRSAGFVLSVCATAGILLLAPVMVRPLLRWMPRWCALAIAVPLAAQLACTPAIAAISGQVSLVAVVANLLAAPAVAPATVAGLLGGLVALVSPPLAHVVGFVAGAAASWILEVGHRAASLEAASLAWRAPWQLLLVVVPTVAWAIVRISARPVLFGGIALGLLVAIWRPPHPGWPPESWLMVACDVGQGDATVLNVGDGTAVVVDAGPEPAAIDRCLDRLDVHHIRLMVFTHGHADHVDGWRGVVRGRQVDQVAVGPTGGPGARPHVAVPGETFTVGAIAAEVLWPPRSEPLPVTDGSSANNVSVVLAVRVHGVRILLTGDIEPEAQARLMLQHPELSAEVMKMPHHGSARQSEAFLDAVGASIVTVSAGVDNDYGHPAAKALAMLRERGAEWWRTDTDGDIAVVLRDGRLLVATTQ